MTADLLSWCASEGRRLDAELQALADRRLALNEIGRAARVAAADAASMTCTPEQLLVAHRDDPAALAGIHSLFARAVDPDPNDTPTIRQEATDADHRTH